MNDMMISYIDKVRKEPEHFIKERSCMERVFNLSPAEQINGISTIMYINQSFYPSFGNTLLMGLEFEFLMIDTLIITFCQRTTMEGSNIVSPSILGVLCAYMFNQILYLMKETYGRRNVASHCMADERFLV